MCLEASAMAQNGMLQRNHKGMQLTSAKLTSVAHLRNRKGRWLAMSCRAVHSSAKVPIVVLVRLFCGAEASGDLNTIYESACECKINACD